MHARKDTHATHRSVTTANQTWKFPSWGRAPAVAKFVWLLFQRILHVPCGHCVVPTPVLNHWWYSLQTCGIRYRGSRPTFWISHSKFPILTTEVVVDIIVIQVLVSVAWLWRTTRIELSRSGVRDIVCLKCWYVFEFPSHIGLSRVGLCFDNSVSTMAEKAWKHACLLAHPNLPRGVVLKKALLSDPHSMLLQQVYWTVKDSQADWWSRSGPNWGSLQPVGEWGSELVWEFFILVVDVVFGSSVSLLVQSWGQCIVEWWGCWKVPGLSN